MKPETKQADERCECGHLKARHNFLDESTIDACYPEPDLDCDCNAYRTTRPAVDEGDLEEEARVFLRGQGLDVISTYGPKLADFARQHTADLQSKLTVAVEALEKWKCSYCCGAGIVPNRMGAWAKEEPITCTVCHGSGLTKIASSALSTIKGEKQDAA